MVDEQLPSPINNFFGMDYFSARTPSITGFGSRLLGTKGKSFPTSVENCECLIPRFFIPMGSNVELVGWSMMIMMWKSTGTDTV